MEYGLTDRVRSRQKIRREGKWNGVSGRGHGWLAPFSTEREHSAHLAMFCCRHMFYSNYGKTSFRIPPCIGLQCIMDWFKSSIPKAFKQLKKEPPIYHVARLGVAFLLLKNEHFLKCKLLQTLQIASTVLLFRLVGRECLLDDDNALVQHMWSAVSKATESSRRMSWIMLPYLSNVINTGSQGNFSAMTRPERIEIISFLQAC